jgi:ribosomal protein L37AE/L43A
MEDYPRTIEEFEARFSSKETCREYLFQLRWPEGFRCPRCSHSKAWAVSATLWQCCQCDHQTSATAGTVFQDTRKPLRMWFRAMWYVTSQKNGASALGLQRVLGLGRSHLLQRFAQTAERLTPKQRWGRLLRFIFRDWLKTRSPDPLFLPLTNLANGQT